MERRCSSCGTWNTNEQRCNNCDALLDPVKIREQEVLNEEERRAAQPKSRVEKWLESMQQSSNPFVKLSYFVLKMFWLVYMGIISFILWFIALGPG